MPALEGTSLVSILSLPTLLLLCIAAHQYLFIFRHLPVLHLLGNTIVDASLAAKRTRTFGLSKNPTSLCLGLVYGVQCTLFVWSLLKLPPACGIVLHVGSATVAETYISYSRRTISALQIATVVALGLVVDRVVPVDSAALMLGVMASALGVGPRLFAVARGHDGASPNTDTTHSLAALLISLLFNALFGPTLFGETRWLPKSFFFLLIPIIISRCRLASERTDPRHVRAYQLVDFVVMAAAGACILQDLQISGPGFAITSNDEAKDRPEITVFSTKDEEKTLSMPQPESQHIRLVDSKNHRLVWLAAMPMMYLASVQSGIVNLPRTWRWDARDFSNNIFKLSTLPLTEHLYAWSSTSVVTPNSTFLATTPPPQLEVVVSYYDESLDGVADLIRRAVVEVPHWSKKVTVYHKGVNFRNNGTSEGSVSRKLRDFITDQKLHDLVDVVIGSKNEGRDSGTHLTHIIENYDNLADFTVFLQGHIPWMFEYDERLKLINERTGFISFGHYLTVTHGHDDWGNGDFRDIERIWKRIYPEKPYPNEPLLATYHGEFGVSRARIRNNPRATYEELRKVLQAPAADPIYQEEGHWGCKGVPDGPENPFFGHSVERAWTFIFRCSDPTIADHCGLSQPASAACYCADDDKSTRP